MKVEELEREGAIGLAETGEAMSRGTRRAFRGGWGRRVGIEQPRKLGRRGCAGNDNGAANFRSCGALKESNHDAARLQPASSDSFSSSLQTEAARNLHKSSPDQESVPSIWRSGASAARRSIHRDNSPVALGGSPRNAVSSDTSREISMISMILDRVCGRLEAICSDQPGREPEIGTARLAALAGGSLTAGVVTAPATVPVF